MNDELLKKAKRLVLNQFGKALAEKATDEFCLNILKSLLSRSSRYFAFESMTEKPTTSSQPGVIMEFKEVSVKSYGGERQSAALKEKFGELLGMFTTEEGAKINVQEVLRQIKLKSYRESILKTIHPLNAFLERSIERERLPMVQNHFNNNPI